MKKPNILAKLKMEYLLPIFELDLDSESEQCRAMGRELKKFYFGYSAISVETIFVYLMVNQIIINSVSFIRNEFIVNIVAFRF